MRRPSMKSFTSLTQTDLAACRCAEPALTRDRAFARIGTLQLTKKNHNSQAAREISISPSVLKHATQEQFSSSKKIIRAIFG